MQTSGEPFIGIHHVAAGPPNPTGRKKSRGEIEEIPELRWRCLEDAVIWSSSPAVISGGVAHVGTLVSESLRLHRAQPVGSYRKGSLRFADETLVAKVPSKRVSISEGIFMGGFGFGAVFHHLVERTPMLAMLKGVPEELRSLPLLIPEEVLRYPQIIEATQLLAPANEIVPLKRAVSYSVGRLLHLDEVAYWRPANNLILVHRPALRHYRDTVRGLLQVNSTEKTDVRLFVERGPRSRARNESELRGVAESFGFVPWRPEEHSFRDQVALWSSASFVAGDSGAALSGLIFLPPHGEGLVNTFSSQKLAWNDLAAVGGAKVRYLAARDDGTVSVASFAKMLADMTSRCD